MGRDKNKIRTKKLNFWAQGVIESHQKNLKSKNNDHREEPQAGDNWLISKTINI